MPIRTPTRAPAPIVDGADISLRAFLLMPVFAAVLSVAMWLELPTFGDALHAREPLVGGRRDLFARLAEDVPTDPVRASACVKPLSPVPTFVVDDDAATNMAILSPEDLTAMGMRRRLPGDQELYLSGQVMWLVRWITDPPFNGRRMSRSRIRAEIEGPIEGNRYVLFYGTREVADSDPEATLRVEAHLYDVASGQRVCAIGVDANAQQPVQAAGRLLGEVNRAATARPR